MEECGRESATARAWRTSGDAPPRPRGPLVVSVPRKGTTRDGDVPRRGYVGGAQKSPAGAVW
jgi:hypothetical protein